MRTRQLLARHAKVVLGWFLLIVLGGCDRKTPTEPTPPPTACQYAVVPAEFTPCMSGLEMTATVSTAPSCQWTVVASAQWMTLTSGVSGRGPGGVRFAVSDNWDAPREGFVTVQGALAGQTAAIHVAQAGCRYWVSQDAFDISTSGASGTFEVLQQSEPIVCGGPLQNACVWTAVADVAWIAIATSMPRTGDDRVSFVVAPNNTGVSRSGTISVRDKVVRITQH
jgi:hypothetical protein